MTNTRRFRWGRALALFVGLLIVIKAADVIVGWTFVPKSDDRVVRSKRTVTVRLHEPNISVTVRPSDHYMKGVDGMQARDLPFRTDDHGFLLGPTRADGPVDITFLGASPVVCMYVDEAKRFPVRVSELLRRADGSPTRTQNGGLSINHNLHSTFNLLTTVLPQKPRMVAIMHNDFFLLATQGSYWTGPPSQVFLQSAADEVPWYRRNAAKRIKDWLMPNIWGYARELVPVPVQRALNFHPGDEFLAHRSKPVPPLERLQGDFRASLVGVVRYLRAWNVEPVLMTQFNRVDLEDTFIRQQYELEPIALSWPDYVKGYKSFNEIIRSVAQEHGLLLIDLDRKIPHSSQYIYDAEHVNDAGAELVARTIAAEIAGRYKDYRIAETR